MDAAPLAPTPAFWRRLVTARLVTYTAAVLLLAAASRWNEMAVIVVGLVAAVATTVAHRIWPSPPRLAGGSIMRPLLVAFGFTGLGLVLLLVAWGGGSYRDAGVLRSVVVFVGTAMVLLGFGSVAALLRKTVETSWVSGVGTTGMVLACFVVGVGALPHWGGWAVGLLAVGVLGAPFGINLLAEAGLNRRVFRHRRWTTVAALLLFVSGGLLFWATDIPVLMNALLLGAGLAFVFTVVVDNEVDAVLVIVLLAITWSVAPRTASADASAVLRVDPAKPVFAALGDSFMSGEGAQEFLDGTNVKGSNQCRRAATAYPVLLAEGSLLPASGTVTSDTAVPDQVVFLACSGALIDQIGLEPQYAGEPLNGPAVLQSDGAYRPGRSQLDQLADRMAAARADVPSQPLDISFVLVSVGGNDARFGTISQTCVAPGDCARLGERWLASLRPDGSESLGARLGEVYDRIAAAVPGVPVVVVPYPVPLSATGCANSAFTGDEHRFLEGFTRELDSVIATSVQGRPGVYFADTMVDAFTDAGTRLCDTEHPDVNWVSLNPVSGALDESANPVNWLHNSLHPNERGHRTLTAALARWLSTNDLTEPQQLDIRPLRTMEQIMCGDAPSAACSAEGTAKGWFGGVPSYCFEPGGAAQTADTAEPTLPRRPSTSCEGRWVKGAISGAVLGFPLVFVLVWLLGAWMASVSLVGRWRSLTA